MARICLADGVLQLALAVPWLLDAVPRYQTTLVVRLAVVAISGVTAARRARARKPGWIAVYGALTGLSAPAAPFLGVLLAG